MKSLIIIILLPILSVAQELTHTYKVEKKTAVYNVNGNEIKYNFHPLFIDSGEHKMVQDTLTYNGENYIYKRNQIIIDGKTFKFNKPWFSKKTRLVNKTSGELLVTYITDHKGHLVEVFKNEDSYNKLDQKTSDIVDTWSTFKQVQYVHYNAKDEDSNSYVPYMVGAIVGALVVK